MSWNHSFFILPCRDGHILLAPFQQWETLVEWMESEKMAGDLADPLYREDGYRVARMDHILQILEQWTRTHTKNELFESGQLMRFPWAPVLSPKEASSSPQLQARSFFIDAEHPELNRSISYPGLPFRMSSSCATRWARAPLIGEDNVQVYRNEMGLSEEEYQRLSALKVI